MSDGPGNVRRAWDELAGFWDERVEAGETWQRFLIAPAVERQLELLQGERILEIATGNGDFARRMAASGADVLATDFSEEMLARARARGADVEYRLVDATDAVAIRALGEAGTFDGAVANMAVMDMIDLHPMAREVHRLVRPGGRFVLSTLHPAFNSGEATQLTEVSDDERGVTRRYSVKVTRYTDERPMRGVAVEGQPVLQWYFHRTLSTILSVFFAAGWVLDGFDEPVLSSVEDDGVFAEIPGVLVIRFRRLAEPTGL